MEEPAERYCSPARQEARSDVATGTLMLLCGFTFLRLEPNAGGACHGGLWQVDVIRRNGQSNARQPGDATTCTDLCSPHRFGEAAPERVAEMVDVGQFLGLRAAKRAGPSAPAAGQLGIFASESEPIPQHAVRFSAWQI